jgi:uncharacterized protein (TIGR00369 family)
MSADAVDEPVRTRTISWDDPVAALAAARELDGLAMMQAIADGRLPPPPIAVLMNMEPVEFVAGRAVFAGIPGEEHYNPIGTVHGGWASTLLDSALGCAIQTTLPAGVGYTTLDLRVTFVRAITRETGRVLATAEVVHRGRRVATAEARLTAERDGRLLAHGGASCVVLEG